jgi:hypothetical protein
MTRTRRLLYQSAMLLALATVSSLRARQAEASSIASAAAMTCGSFGCTTDCGEVWFDICAGCPGGDYFPVCQPDLWGCGPGEFKYFCGFAS